MNTHKHTTNLKGLVALNNLQIWADGGCRNNGKPNALGGQGWVAVGDDTEITCNYGSSKKLITNNQNEIMSVTNALQSIVNLKDGFSFEVCMDSAYVVNCINDKWYVGWKKNGWKNSKKKPVENKELWIDLLKEVERFGNRLTFSKTKGHSGVKWNERADELANKAMDEHEERRSWGIE